MLNLINIILLTIITFFNQLFSFFPFVDFLQDPCGKIITFKVSQVDSGFNLSTTDAIKYAKEAADLWNTGVHKQVLKYDPNGQIDISFVYDERQIKTIQKKILEEKIRAQKSQLSQTNKSIELKEVDFNIQKVAYEQKSSELSNKLEVYNDKIVQINNAGGATPEQANQLDQEKKILDLEIRNLETQRINLNNNLAIINQMVDDFNNNANNVNKIVNQANVYVGSEFEEGHLQGNKIVLYEYETTLDLKRLLAHELGHALRLGHVEDKNSIMYYLNTSSKFSLSQNDLEEYKKVCNIKLNTRASY